MPYKRRVSTWSSGGFGLLFGSEIVNVHDLGQLGSRHLVHGLDFILMYVNAQSFAI